MKRGVLFRCGTMTCATADDIKKLRDELGIKTYIDLRSGKAFQEHLDGADGPVFEVYPPSPWPLKKEHRPEGGFVDPGPGHRRRVNVNLMEGLAPTPGPN